MSVTNTKPKPTTAAYRRAVRELKAYATAQRLIVQAEVASMIGGV